MSDVRSFSVLSSQDGESGEEREREREREREEGDVLRSTVSIRPRGIADCDNVAENKLGHGGRVRTGERASKGASKQRRFQIQHCKSECEKNLLRIANAIAAVSVLHG